MNDFFPSFKKVSFFEVIVFFLAFSLNIILQNNAIVAFANSLTLFLSVSLFQFLSYRRISQNKYLLLSLFFIPLILFNPQNLIISFSPSVFLLIWIFIAIKNYDKWFLCIGILIIFSLQLIAAGIIKSSFYINFNQLIFSEPSVQNAIIKHQQDALYLPFKLRALLFNSSVYIYYGLTRLADFLTLQTLIEILLLVNLYPLFSGVLISLKKLSKREAFIYSGIILNFVIIAINRSPDKFISFFVISPLLLYLIILGFEKINFIIFALLFLISLIITIT